ncbi:MAG: lipid A biosynthesis acyltransferase, partial [Candidatus Marinimicrobia bacterium]|nr:lipid A biosynthesis acyltransferase [Candidatus Neomarinimicrobiota bacterium]
ETKNTDSHEEITAHFTQKIEDVVQQYPEQYFWFHRRWKSL